MQMVTQPTPVAYAQQKLAPQMGALHGMQVALSFGNAGEESKRKQILGVCDVSFLPRFGVKGLNVLQWLRAGKLNIPADPNTWEPQESGALVLRLGNSEFLVEDQPGGNVCDSLNAAVEKSIHGLYKVLRNDASFILSGSEVMALFSELCSLDLRSEVLAANGLVMTQVAGISATVLRQYVNGEPVYRLWCDGTYGAYMWKTLVGIASEHGGGAVGVAKHYAGIF